MMFPWSEITTILSLLRLFSLFRTACCRSTFSEYVGTTNLSSKKKSAKLMTKENTSRGEVKRIRGIPEANTAISSLFA